jgi:UDP-glucose 4-epimerase
MRINVAGTLNLLQAAVRPRLTRFIFASTGGAIVGNVLLPVQEEMMPGPISPYGAGKLAGEGYCSALWGSYGLPTISLRFSNVYGPLSYHKGSVISKFFRQVIRGEELMVYGDGEQSRDFLYVADLCQAIAAAVSAAELPVGRAIQLGTGKETSLNQLLAEMRQVVGKPRFPKIRYAPPRPGEVRRSFVSISRAQQFLNFSPQIELLAGLQQTWEWFQKESSIRN